MIQFTEVENKMFVNLAGFCTGLTDGRRFQSSSRPKDTDLAAQGAWDGLSMLITNQLAAAAFVYGEKNYKKFFFSSYCRGLKNQLGDTKDFDEKDPHTGVQEYEYTMGQMAGPPFNWFDPYANDIETANKLAQKGMEWLGARRLLQKPEILERFQKAYPEYAEATPAFFKKLDAAIQAVPPAPNPPSYSASVKEKKRDGKA